MSAPPYMKLFWADYHKDTRHLSRDEHGAYFLLIGEAWNRGGYLPDDDGLLARLTLATPQEWARLKPIVMAYFRPTKGRWRHKRVAVELASYEEVSRKRKAAGKKGGSVRREKDRDISLANAKAIADHKPTKPEPEPEPKKEDATASIVRSGAPRRTEVDDVQEAFAAWNTMAARTGLATARTMDAGRRAAIKARLADGGLPTWLTAVAAVEASPHCRGENDRGWRADLDFVCQPKSWRRLLEGFYGGKPVSTGPLGDDWPESRWAIAVDLWRSESQWEPRLGPEPGKPGCRVPPSLLIQPTANGSAA